MVGQSDVNWLVTFHLYCCLLSAVSFTNTLKNFMAVKVAFPRNLVVPGLTLTALTQSVEIDGTGIQRRVVACTRTLQANAGHISYGL